MAKASLDKIILRDVVLLVLLSVAIGAAVNHFRPDGIKWVENWTEKRLAELSKDGTVDLEQAHDLWRRNEVLFVDARSSESFASGHVPRALSAPFNPFTTDHSHILALPKEENLVLYCDGIGCDLSHEMADFLRMNGYNKILLMPEGIEGWINAGYPVEEGS